MREIMLDENKNVLMNGATSKGNQAKWREKNIWYKADQMGYEGLSEVVVSELLKNSDVTDFVSYVPVLLHVGKQTRTGCFSAEFKQPKEELVTLERLCRAYTGQSFAQVINAYSDVKDKIAFAVDFVQQHTDLERFGAYLTAMLTLDAFFLNEDRHFNNIALIHNEETKQFRFCPYFDFGLSLLSDVQDYPMQKELYANIDTVRAKPFDTDFDVQLEAAERLFGQQVHFSFSDAQIVQAVNGCREYYEANALQRVTELLRARRHKFRYLF